MSAPSRYVHLQEVLPITDTCQVPSLFQDNFDYGDIRKDFVHGILTSDLLMKNIYCYTAKDGYAARVKDTKSYDSIRLVVAPPRLSSSTYSVCSKDILSRWTFPLVPDDNHPGGHSYEHLRGNKYIAADGSVILSRWVCVHIVMLLPRNFPQNMQNWQPDTHRIKEPDRG